MSELASTIVDHYERHARAWDADRQAAAWNEKIWLDRFAGLLPASGRVLDLGCGAGSPIARHLAGQGFQVTGVDSSPTMIGLCRERLPGHDWIVADMRTLALDRQFDGILAWDSFFHLDFDAQRRMFLVFARHAVASAVLMFNTGPAHGIAVGTYRGDPLFHASLDAEEYRALIAASGFAVVEHAAEDPRAGGRTVWLCRATGEGFRSEAASAMERGSVP